ncbi:MAG: hypothetical protein JWP69_482 [Flaviaesturariibacter sp.]|nr:hypothetical protein [Flaviaesturariibacter sp.]
MSRLLNCLLPLFLLSACQKEISPELANRAPGATPLPAAAEFVKYTIKAGEHFCDKSDFKIVETDELKFMVRFDSSAIYQTVNSSNQDDINKLYGFSDNNMQHHQFSARFGWRWSAGALRLFGYIYNNSIVASKEISAIPIGADVVCNLQVTATHYRFMVGNLKDSLPRLSTTAKAKGYQLYPYFGGDEPAPHTVSIWIKPLM